LIPDTISQEESQSFSDTLFACPMKNTFRVVLPQRGLMLIFQKNNELFWRGMDKLDTCTQWQFEKKEVLIVTQSKVKK
jgi:hypothetical protein